MAEPIATDIQQQFRTLDPTTRELFFGSGIPGTSSYSPGFMQQAFRASEKTFYDEQGNPIVVPEQVAGLSPEQLSAINLSREKIGVQDPYLQQSQQAYGSGLESLFGGLGESEQALRDYASAEYDPSSYQQYMDPYQEQVIDQVRKDILEQGAKGDISARASDIARGGESAFGSRARLGAGERTEALGRGLGEALGGLRSQGFQQAQQTAMGEFGRQQQAQQGLAQGLGSLAGARQAGQFGAGQAIKQALAGISPPPRQMTGYDLASEVGKGLLAQQGEKFPSIGRGVGLGFQSFKQLSDEIREKSRTQKQERDLLAFGMAYKEKDSSRPTGQYVYDTKDGIYREYATDDGIQFLGAKGRLTNEEFTTMYPDAELTDKSDIAGKLPEYSFVQGLKDKIFEDEKGINLLENYFQTVDGAFDEEKGGGMGLNFVAVAFSRNVKTILGNKNLSPAEIDQYLASGMLQSLLGAMRKEVVGGGVMTEQDAKRVIQALGGNINAMTNPTLVAAALRRLYTEKYNSYSKAVDDYNRVPKRGALKRFENVEKRRDNEKIIEELANEGKVPTTAVLVETQPDKFNPDKIGLYVYHDSATGITYELNSRGGVQQYEEERTVNPNLKDFRDELESGGTDD
jgi:Sec-independent protein translocase protein TatA